jgi:predicted pyridoxine 5'-phosphate oxidase superfamily flavin-nucleotide-binding protein
VITVSLKSLALPRDLGHTTRAIIPLSGRVISIRNALSRGCLDFIMLVIPHDLERPVGRAYLRESLPMSRLNVHSREATTMANDPAALVFPPSARAAQERLGSRALQARRERPGGFSQTVDERLRAFLSRLDSFFIATATADGHPYIQHRGGPKGFLKVLGPSTLGFADFSGNRQYITVGRLAENPRVCLFLINYERRARVKLWGRAAVVEGDPALLGRLADPAYGARIERAILIEIDVWDVNCRQHIPQKLAAEDVAVEIRRLQSRIRELEIENDLLKQRK